MELITNKGQIDTYDSFAWALNYKSAEIVNLKGRKASFSKTIKIPYTKTNRLIFDGLPEFNVDNVGYNTKGFLTCYITHNGSLLMTGTLTMLQYDELKEEQVVQLQLIAKVKTMVTELKKLKLNEVDFSRWNHEYSQGNIFNNIIYSSCNLDDVTVQTPLGKGYIYPLVDYGKDDTQGVESWTVTDLKPTLFLKEYVDTLFRLAGLSYTSLFFESDYWKSLVILNSVGKVAFTELQLAPFGTMVERTSVQKTYVEELGFPPTSSCNPPLPVNQIWNDQFEYLDFTNEVIDTEDSWDITLPIDEYTAPKQGEYSFKLNAEFYHEFASDPNTVFGQTQLNNAFFNDFPTTFVINPNGIIEDHYIQILINGVVYDSAPFPAVAPQSISTYLDWQGCFTLDWLRPSGLQIKNQEWNLTLNAGDKITFRTLDEDRQAIWSSNEKSSLIHRFYFERFSVVTEITEALVTEGNEVNFGNYISKIKATDFINGIFDAFNLWVIDDPLNEDNLIIEPRSNFFDSGGYVDMSKKLDISRTISSDFLADKLPKYYNYLFKKGNDIGNTDYDALNELGYADYVSEVDIDFVNREQKIQTLFAPLITHQEGNLFFPKEYQIDGLTKSPIGEFLKIGFAELVQGEWELRSTISPDVILNEYWKVSEFSSVQNPTFSLTFGDANANFDIGNKPHWNMYRLFHEITEKEQTRNGSKEITAYFNLTENDIADLDLRRAWFVRGVYFRIVSVDNFNPLSNTSTKVKLLQIESPKFDYTSNEVIYNDGFKSASVSVLGTNKANEIVNTKNGYVQLS
jgi:hypothetical protein